MWKDRHIVIDPTPCRFNAIAIYADAWGLTVQRVPKTGCF
jgi:hypothetical protein